MQPKTYAADSAGSWDGLHPEGAENASPQVTVLRPLP